MNQRSLLASLPIVVGLLSLLAADGEARAGGNWPRDPRRPIVPDARPLALGEAYRGVANGNGALWYNPAGLAFFPTYSIEANYLYAPWLEMHQASASVVDTKTNQTLGAGVAYTYVNAGKNPFPDPESGESSRDLSYHSTRVGMCVPVVENTFALGLNLHYVKSDVDRGTDDHWFSVDVAGLLRIADFLSLGVVGHNLTNTASPTAPIALGTGLAVYPVAALLLAFDLVVDFQSRPDPALEYHAGIEYQFLFGEGEGSAQAFALRAGYLYDDVRDRQMVSGGMAYVNPTGAVEFTVRSGVAGEGTDEDEDQIYAVALKLFM